LKPLMVKIQAEVWLPKPMVRDPSRLTKKRVRQTIVIGTGRVLYHDRDLILVRAFGSTSTFYPHGQARSGSHKTTHPKHELLESAFWWQLTPASVEKLKLALKRKR
jgi:hypothetical protein